MASPENIFSEEAIYLFIYYSFQTVLTEASCAFCITDTSDGFPLCFNTNAITKFNIKHAEKKYNVIE